MLAFKREAVALVVLAFYFLVLDQQTQESRLQQLLLLQHLKRSRRKRLILLQIALRKTRRVRRAWSWPRNQFWFETLPFGLVAFVMICVFVFCHNFFVDRNQTWKPGRKPGLENVIEWDWRNPDTTGCEILCDRKRMYLSSKPWLPALTMPARSVNRMCICKQKVKVLKTPNDRQSYILSKSHKIEKFQLI